MKRVRLIALDMDGPLLNEKNAAAQRPSDRSAAKHRRHSQGGCGGDSRLHLHGAHDRGCKRFCEAAEFALHVDCLQRHANQRRAASGGAYSLQALA